MSCALKNFFLVLVYHSVYVKVPAHVSVCKELGARWIFLSNLGDRNEAAIPSLPSEQRKSRRVLDYVLARREEQNLAFFPK